MVKARDVLAVLFVLAVGMLIGWTLHRSDCMVAAALRVIDTAEAYRAATCETLAPQLTPGLC